MKKHRFHVLLVLNGLYEKQTDDHAGPIPPKVEKEYQRWHSFSTLADSRNNGLSVCAYSMNG